MFEKDKRDVSVLKSAVASDKRMHGYNTFSHDTLNSWRYEEGIETGKYKLNFQTHTKYDTTDLKSKKYCQSNLI